LSENTNDEVKKSFITLAPGQVLVEVELLLQLRQLFRREVGPAGVVDAAGVVTARIAVRVGFRNWKKK
jgi:hypothetical protein